MEIFSEIKNTFIGIVETCLLNLEKFNKYIIYYNNLVSNDQNYIKTKNISKELMTNLWAKRMKNINKQLEELLDAFTKNLIEETCVAIRTKPFRKKEKELIQTFFEKADFEEIPGYSELVAFILNPADVDRKSCSTSKTADLELMDNFMNEKIGLLERNHTKLANSDKKALEELVSDVSAFYERLSLQSKTILMLQSRIGDLQSQVTHFKKKDFKLGFCNLFF